MIVLADTSLILFHPFVLLREVFKLKSWCLISGKLLPSYFDFLIFHWIICILQYGFIFNEQLWKVYSIYYYCLGFFQVNPAEIKWYQHNIQVTFANTIYSIKKMQQTQKQYLSKSTTKLQKTRCEFSNLLTAIKA